MTKTGIVNIGPLGRICRICLQQSNSMSNIFGPSIETSADQIAYVTSLELSQDDGLPKKVCTDCLKDVRTSAAFKKRAIASDTMLRVLQNATIKVKQNSTTMNSTQNICNLPMNPALSELVNDIGIKIHDQQNVNVNSKKGDLNNTIEQRPPNGINILKTMLQDTYTSKKTITRIERVNNNLSRTILPGNNQKTPIIRKVTPVIQKFHKMSNPVRNVECSSYTDNYEIVSIIDDHVMPSINLYENREPPPLAPLTYSDPVDAEIKTEHEVEEYEATPVKSRRYMMEYSLDGKPEFKLLDDEEPNIKEINEAPTIDKVTNKEEESGDIIEEQMCEEQWIIDESEADEPLVTEIIKPVSDGSVPRPQSRKVLQRNANGRHVLRVMKTKKVFECDTCSFKTDMRFKLSKHMKQHLNKLDFLCKFPGCGKAYVSNGLLSIHERKHTRENLPKCDTCSKTFINKVSLLNHKSYIHGGIKRYSCKSCENTFVSATGLRQHMGIHNGIKLYLCEYCGKSFRMMKSLRSHLETHAEYRKYKCETCGKCFKQNSVLQKHNRVIHDLSSKYACKICFQNFPFPYLLQRHVESVHNQSDKRCTRCNKPFGNDNDLAAHEYKHDNPRELQCHMCLKIYKNEDDLNSHICKLAKTSTYYCRECKIVIRGPEKFDNHNREVHNKITTVKQIQSNTSEDMQRVTCEFCPKVLQKFRMEKHIYNYHNPNRFQCPICEKRLKTLTSYLRHKRMHEGFRPYKCNLCSKEFLQNTSLHYHKMEHTGERPEKCRFCDGAFKRVGDLRVHERRHINRMSESERKKFLNSDIVPSKKRTYISEEDISKFKSPTKSETNFEEMEYISEENQEYISEENQEYIDEKIILTDGIDYSSIIEDNSEEQEFKVEYVYRENENSSEAIEEVYEQYEEYEGYKILEPDSNQERLSFKQEEC